MFSKTKTIDHQVADLIEECATLVEHAEQVRDGERAQRRQWNHDHVIPWQQRCDAARQELLDYAAQHRRELGDARELVVDGKFHLIDLEVVKGLADRHRLAQALVDAAPEQPPSTAETVLQQMRRRADQRERINRVDWLLEKLLGPAPQRAFTAASEVAARWREDLRELPPEVYVPIPGGRDLIFRHPAIAQRLAEAAEPVPA